MGPSRTRSLLAWAGLWSVVFGANLIFPALLGAALVGWENGRAGMLVGIWGLWAAGVFAGLGPARLRTSLLAGGYVAALLQLFPVLQLLAGLTAAAAWGRTLGLPWEPGEGTARGSQTSGRSG